MVTVMTLGLGCGGGGTADGDGVVRGGSSPPPSLRSPGGIGTLGPEYFGTGGLLAGSGFFLGPPNTPTFLMNKFSVLLPMLPRGQYEQTTSLLPRGNLLVVVVMRGKAGGSTHHIWWPRIGHLWSLTAHATFVVSFHASYVSPISHAATRVKRMGLAQAKQYLSVVSNFVKNVGRRIRDMQIIKSGSWIILLVFLCKRVDRQLGTPTRRRIQILTRRATLFFSPHIVRIRAHVSIKVYMDWFMRKSNTHGMSKHAFRGHAL